MGRIRAKDIPFALKEQARQFLLGKEPPEFLKTYKAELNPDSGIGKWKAHPDYVTSWQPPLGESDGRNRERNLPYRNQEEIAFAKAVIAVLNPDITETSHRDADMSVRTSENELGGTVKIMVTDDFLKERMAALQSGRGKPKKSE